MASNQTPNYGLSQWKRTDQVRMEDFNADNAKIDAEKCREVLLMSKRDGLKYGDGGLQRGQRQN